MMNNRFLLFIILIRFTIAENTFTLYLRDFWLEKPLAGVVVTIGAQQYISDLSGNVVLPSGYDSEADVEIRKNNYFTLVVKFHTLHDFQLIYLQAMEKSDDIKVEGARMQMGKRDMPGSYTLVGLGAYEQMDSEELIRTLQTTPGIFIKDYGSSSGLKSISIRGLNAEHTLLAYDGIPLTNPQLGMNDLTIITDVSLRAMEIYRGGNALLFGSGAVGGALNLIPQEPDSQKQIILDIRHGSWQNYRYGLNVQIPTGRVFHHFGFGYHHAQNGYPYRYQNQTFYRSNNDITSWNISYSIKPAEIPILTEIVYHTAEKGQPKSSFLGEGVARQSSHYLFSRIKWQIKQNTTLQLFNQRQFIHYQDPEILVHTIPLDSRHTTTVSGMIGHMLFNLSHSCMIQINTDADYQTISSTDAGNHRRYKAGFAAILNRLLYKRNRQICIVYPSIRMDYYSDVAWQILPKVGITFSNYWYDLFFSLGKNFRVPTFNELFWQPGGNSALHPESALNWEAGIRSKFEQYGQWQLGATLYQNRLQDMIRWMPSGGNDIWQPFNINTVQGQGIEFELQFYPHQSFFLQSNYGISETIKLGEDFPGDQTANKQLPYLPQEFFTFMVSWYTHRCHISMRTRRTSFRYTTLENRSDAVLPSYWIFDGSVSFESEYWNRKASLFLSLNNLTDVSYQIMEGYPMPGRAFSMGLRLSLQKNHSDRLNQE